MCIRSSVLVSEFVANDDELMKTTGCICLQI